VGGGRSLGTVHKADMKPGPTQQMNGLGDMVDFQEVPPVKVKSNRRKQIKYNGEEFYYRGYTLFFFFS